MDDKKFGMVLSAFADGMVNCAPGTCEFDRVVNGLREEANILDSGGDTEVAPPVNNEAAYGSRSSFCQWARDKLLELDHENESAPPRRSWKRWAYIDGGVALGNVLTSNLEGMMHPVTVIEGHIDIAEIEREAFEAGQMSLPSFMRMVHRAYFDKAKADGYTAPQPIAGVEPVVVEGFTFGNPFRPREFPWSYSCVTGEDAICVYKNQGGTVSTPCTVAIWQGVVGGKRVGGEAGE